MEDDQDEDSIVIELPAAAHQEGYLDGQFLIAMPSMSDERFHRSLIYVCAHSEDGAMGIVVNRPVNDLRFSQLLMQLNIITAQDMIHLPTTTENMAILQGGPVETGRGFVLHSPDYFVNQSTMPISDGICMTVTLDILRAIATGEGPNKAMLALGYAGWGAGQLEKEILENGWLTCPSDPGLLFDTELDTRYDRALRQLGVDPAMLSSTAGHA